MIIVVTILTIAFTCSGYCEGCIRFIVMHNERVLLPLLMIVCNDIILKPLVCCRLASSLSRYGNDSLIIRSWVQFLLWSEYFSVLVWAISITRANASWD